MTEIPTEPTAARRAHARLPMPCRLASVALAGFLAALLAATGTAAEQPPPAPPGEGILDFDRLFADDASGLRPEGLAWAPDGRRLAYRWDDGRGDTLWVLDTAAEAPAAARAVLTPGEAGVDADFELGEVVWAPDSASVFLLSEGDLWQLRLAGGEEGAPELRRLTETEAEEEDPKPSPDGSRLAFVRDFDLQLLDLETGRERALTTDGEENVTLNGVTDWVYWEELWGRDSTGFWWSPDGTRIAYYRFDETPVASYPILDPSGKYPTVRWQKYPKAGTDNPKVKVGVYHLDRIGRDDATVWLDTTAGGETDPTAYLARVHWPPAGDEEPDGWGDVIAVERLNRDQDRLDLLVCSPGDGACEVRLSEEEPTWVNLGDEVHLLRGGRLLWPSERSGWRHLYLYDASGRFVRRLTPDSTPVTSLDAVGPDGEWIVYSTRPERLEGRTGPGSDAGSEGAADLLGAARRQVMRLVVTPTDAAAGPPEPVPLTSRPGWNRATVSEVSGRWVHEWSSIDRPPEIVLRDETGVALDGVELPQEPPPYDPADLPRWRFFTIPGPEGSRLPAALLEPAGFDPERRWPVVTYHYGCPASQVVADRWGARGLWHKLMAERGYAVLMVDNLASTFFGKRGEDRAHRRFGPGNLAAQEAGAAWLAGQPWADAGRIGLWGWSGGGSNTLYALLESPGTWRAGVAGAPVTDWHLYDTIWTERYLDHPEGNEEGYRLSSPVTYADRLEDALLVVHGTGDDNVHPQNTLVMIDALVEAGKPFEDAIYPNQKHGLRGPASRHFYERMTEFFERWLAPAADGAPEVEEPEERR